MKEILIDRLENQIEKMFETLIEIQKEEKETPIRELSNYHKTTLWMIFFNQVLLKSAWNNLLKKVTQEQALEYIQEVWEMTHEHFLNLYAYDSKKTTNNS